MKYTIEVLSEHGPSQFVRSVNENGNFLRCTDISKARYWEEKFGAYQYMDKIQKKKPEVRVRLVLIPSYDVMDQRASKP